MQNKLLVLLFVCFSIKLTAQQSKLNNYKYVIVNERFDFVKSRDAYQTSSLTKFLLEKNGFNVFFADETLPRELSVNKCLALYANVIDNSSAFTIKTILQFKDCNNTVIYTTAEGKSKIKDYKRGYQDAIRKTHNSLSNFSYKYIPKAIPQKSLLDKTKVKNDATAVEEEVEKKPIQAKLDSIETLNAKPIKNGFSLSNSKSVEVFQVLKTSNKNNFILKNKNGIIILKNGVWIAEYYKKEKLVQQKYRINF